MNIKSIVEKFESFGLSHSFLKQNGRIVIGLSGGPDSLAMTLLFQEIQKKYSLFLMVAHVNYHLRGAESDLDERFVKEFCFKHNLPLYILQANIKENENVQVTARNIRLEYLKKLKKHYKMDFIAFGHHKNDQAETILHRMIRGAGFTGLAGINPRKDDVIHPILNLDKKQLLEYLKHKGVEYRIDQTNIASDYTRNKIRNNLLPLLQKEYNPNFEQRLIDYGNLFYLSDNYFNQQAKKEFKKCVVSKTENEIIFDLSALRGCFPVLRFYICKEAWSSLVSKDKDFYAVHFNDIMAIVESESGYKETHLPENVHVMKDYQNLIFRKQTLDARHQISDTRVQIKEISSVRNSFSFNEYRFTMQKTKHVSGITSQAVNTQPFGQLFVERNNKYGVEDREHVILDLDKIVFPIKCRYRMPGDKFIPLGMNNFKKLKNFFIDEKVSLLERDSVVMFTDAEKIIWVCGYRMDQRVAVSDTTKNFLHIKCENMADLKNRSAERKVRLSRK